MVRTRSESKGYEKLSSSASSSRKGLLTTTTTRTPTIRKHVVSTNNNKSSKPNKKHKREERLSKRKTNDAEILSVENSIIIYNKKKKINKDKVNTPSIIGVGDTVNLSDLLFTNYRDYLITCHQSHKRVCIPFCLLLLLFSIFLIENTVGIMCYNIIFFFVCFTLCFSLFY